LSSEQVGKFLAAVEPAGLTPEDSRLLAAFDSLDVRQQELTLSAVEAVAWKRLLEERDRQLNEKGDGC
jgi:hypothetical protein